MTVETDFSDNAIADFLNAAGWADASLKPIAGDASTRRYMRVLDADRPAILMIAPPGAETADCPPQAGLKERRALGYNALARLAGPNLHAFVAISSALRDAGLSAPEVYAADPSQGLALIEDLGDDLFARVAAGDSEAALYRAAVDVLVAMRARAPERPAGEAFTMLDYDGPALLAEAELLADWYWPLRAGAAPASDEKSEYMELFRILLDDLAPPHSFVLRDYHAENLLWLPEREGVARVGLIDFQDALYGAAAYDLVSLLEDARRDVAPELAHAMIDRYCARAKETGAFDEAAFRRDYALLAAQRNAKILGIFARLAKRDGKPRYLDLLPRVEAHFQRDLLRPELAPLRRFFADRMPALAS